MNILVVLPYSPANPVFGGSLRIFHLLKHLCMHHQVTVTGFSTPDETAELVLNLPQLKGKTYFVPPPDLKLRRYTLLLRSLLSKHSYWHHLTRSQALQQQLDRLTLRDSYDVILCEFPVMAMFRYQTEALKIIDAHNVEYDNFRRMSHVSNIVKKMFYKLEARKFRREEIDVCRRQDALFVTSKRDISLFDKTVPGVAKYLIPNGVDTRYYAPSPVIPRPKSLVFVGKMNYLPNYDGMNYFLDEIFPRIQAVYPETTLTIVGSHPPASIVRRSGPQVRVTGFVEDTRPFIQEACVYIVPLRMGGGTRLKIVEALASKIPLVTTPVGCEGIDVENRISAFIAEDPQVFADAVIELFEREELREKLKHYGHELVTTSYRWECSGERMDRALDGLLAHRTALQQRGADTMRYEANGVHP